MKLNMAMLGAQLKRALGGGSKKPETKEKKMARMVGNNLPRPWPKAFGGKRQWKVRKARNHGNGKAA